MKDLPHDPFGLPIGKPLPPAKPTSSASPSAINVAQHDPLKSLGGGGQSYPKNPPKERNMSRPLTGLEWAYSASPPATAKPVERPYTGVYCIGPNPNYTPRLVETLPATHSVYTPVGKDIQHA